MITTPESVYSPKYLLDDVLFPLSKPFDEGYLQVSSLHSIFYSQYGNPNGAPVVFLHGGPGAGTSSSNARFFDPAFYRIVIFDQRGCGRSKPLGELGENSTQNLIADIEQLRISLGIDKWMVFGGSWGSTLAMLYGQAHPDQCLGFVLRGIFCATEQEIKSLWNANDDIFPEVYEEFVGFLPEDERSDLMNSYHKRFLDPDPEIHLPAMRSFIKYDTTIAFLMQGDQRALEDLNDQDLVFGMSRICAHYCINHCFIKENQILDEINKIAHYPVIIVQGRYDIICRPKMAYKLHKAWKGSELVLVPDSGHSSIEVGVARELVRATQKMKSIFNV